jgi:plasmid stability protein
MPSTHTQQKARKARTKVIATARFDMQEPPRAKLRNYNRLLSYDLRFKADPSFRIPRLGLDTRPKGTIMVPQRCYQRTLMPTITVKNIPDDLYDRLKRSAEAHRRSINSEIIVCIERAVSARPVDVPAVLARARRMREKFAGPPLSDEEITQAKVAGRP